MMGWRAGLLAASLAAAFALMSGYGGAAEVHSAAVEPAAASMPCGGQIIARSGVKAVLDGRNVVLDDGRVVHLAAIEVPLLPAPGGTAAQAALATLLSGAQVALRQAQSDLESNAEPNVAPDRYGRTIAYVETLRGDTQRSVQAEMLAAGLARVGEDAGSQACATELLRREAAARQATLGLWAGPYYDPIPADDPASILAQRDRFALVEGEVASVHESGATLYVNFGRRWTEDFAVTVRKRNARNFTAAGLDLNGLAGRRVRVRGWIEAHSGGTGPEDPAAGSRWHGPWIEAAHPAQIELADHD